ncbi:MAG: hypothetical protein AB7O73_15395 [Bacteroidia bacterium]
MKKIISIFCLIAGGLLLVICLDSCSGSTMITGTWKKADVDRKYNHILVAALSGTTTGKSILEEELVRNLSTRGLTITKSIDILPPNFINDDNHKQQLLDSIRGSGIDAILTVSLIDQKTETRYVPGTYNYAPYPSFGYYGTFWGYYNYWYPRFETPGYYVEDNVYFLETNIYDARSEELIWSAQSQTYNPSTRQSFSQEFARDITARLIKEKII